MGRKSTKEIKNIYQISRENMEYSREAAAEKLGFISSDRIEKIENERTLPHPEEVLAMADCYKNPSLCNYFCSHECPIGIEYVPEIHAKELSQITLEMLATLNRLSHAKERLIEITVDGELSEDELPDFLRIKDELSKMALAIDSLNLWLDHTIASGKIDKQVLEEIIHRK
ncbi:helix-turn-helix domain-containing protein [Bariatricus sp. HCP28S3_A7]|uniref:helix-turn-helix domain-containing protein n=1 Tax=Lachnospiraceae TaxID=186803 RepID=UPI003D07F628